MNIGTRIKNKRLELGLSQPELAERCGWDSQSRISQYERNLRAPKAPDLKRIAEALAVSPAWLQFGEGYSETQGPQAGSLLGYLKTLNELPLLAPILELQQVESYMSISAKLDEVDLSELSGYTFLTLDKTLFSTAISKHCFAIRITDDSMSPDFLHGDIVVFDPELPPNPGDLVIASVSIHPMPLFRKYRLGAQDTNNQPITELLPLNQDWPSYAIGTAHPGKIIGTMIEHRKLRHK